MKIAGMTALAVALSGLGALIFTPACGVVTAPLSVPEAIAQNANFSFSGSIVDENGHPLDDVLVATAWSHHFWTPVAGGTDTSENSLKSLSKKFSMNERGTELTAKFSKDGYHDASYTLSASNADYISTDAGDWRNAENFPVVLYSNTRRMESLRTWNGVIDYASYPKEPVLDLMKIHSRNVPTVMLDAQDAKERPAGSLYLTIVKGTPQTLNSHGDVDPASVNLPESIAMHISGEDGGFIRIEPRLGYDPIGSSDTAPTTGYSPDLTLDRARLLEMRQSPQQRIIEAREYFYFRAAGCYGKGCIEWSRPALHDDKTVSPLAFHYYFWLQPALGNPALTTGGGKLP